mgnify:CR=1 FL=1
MRAHTPDHEIQHGHLPGDAHGAQSVRSGILHVHQIESDLQGVGQHDRQGKSDEL